MMPTLNRLTGRFFAVLISLSLAILVPRAMYAGGGTKSPSPTLCQISDTVYRADGTPAQGTVLLSWQAFTTAAGQAVSPGSLLVTLDANGGFNASVAPNTGASPAGTYYKAIFKLSDGTSETEFWVVPNTQTTTIGAIRSKLVPAQQAAQFLTRDYADSNYVSLASTQSITGVKTFSASPAVPTPQNPSDAANKSYVDANSGNGNLASPPPIGNVTPNAITATDLKTLYFPLVDVRAYGAVGDAKWLGSGCSITGGTAALTCPSGTFASGDPGKTITISEAGTATGCTAGHPNGKCPFKTTILSYTDSAHVTLAANAISTASNTPILFGTDNRSAIQAAIDFALNTNTSEFDVYIPHALGQGTASSTSTPGCYLVDGTITLPNSAQNQFKWVRLRGDGNTASALCEANWTKDLILASYPGGAGTEYWFKDFGLYGSNNYYNPSGIHCQNCPAARFEGLWFSGFQAGILADPSGSGHGSQLLKVWGNTFEFTYSALKWNNASNGDNQFLDMHDNMIDIGSFNWALDGSGNPLYPYSIDLNRVAGAKIFDNFFWGDGRGIRCIDCPDLDVYDNDFTFMSNSLLAGEGSDPSHYYGYQNLSLSGTGIGYARRQNIHGNHFASSNAEAVDVVGNVFAQFSGNVYTYNGCCTSGQPYMSVTAANGGNTLNISNEWIDASAAPAISVASGSLAAGSIISDNYFAAGVTPFSISGTLPAGSCVATHSLDACTPGSMSLGSGPSTQGSMNLGNNAPIAARNAENSADVALIFLDGLDRVHLGYTWGGNPAQTFLEGALSYQNVVGVHYLVSHYGSIQAAINAAYGSGVVSGVVVDDRTSAYTGAGFNVPDSVTVQLAPVTYTISSTVTFNNGNNNVTAGIIVQPGGRLLGQSTSSNHGTILQPANSLNADLIASSTVGTGTGTSVQWWHWGEIANLRIVGNGANQTSGDCIRIENMGETARVHDIELSGCYLNNVEFIGASATQSAVADITTNRSANGSGVAFTNLSGVAVLNGISGDCNQVSLISSNQNSAGTLQITGLKAEGESSICSGAVQDPVILSTTTSSTVAASIKVDGGYAFGTSQVNFLKSTGPGTIQFALNNFYLNSYTNILNDTVRGAVIANVSTTTKQPVSYLSNGMIFGNQAFTFQPNTFMQGNPNGTPTEIFGLGSDSSTDIAAAGNGDNTKYFTGGLKFGTFNRTVFGQSPEFQARMGWRWTNPGYDTNTWTFIPVWGTGDTSVRWIGDPNQRWPEVYAADVNATTATVGTLNVTTCNGCGGSFEQVNSDWNASSGVAQILNKPALATVATSGNYNDLSNKPTIPVQGAHLVSGSMQGNTSTLTGNSADQTIYSATLPAGTFTVGTGAHCWAKWQHTTNGSTAITYKWTLGAATVAYAGFTSASQSVSSDIEVLTPSALTSQIINASAVIAGNGFQAGQSYGNAGSENLANSDTIKFTFNASSGEQVKGVSFYCQTVQ